MRSTYQSLWAALVILLALAHITHPVWATVDITTALDYNTYGGFIISFDARSEPNLPRAFALDIRLDNDANIVDVILLTSDYIIFPGTIQIDAQGKVTDYGTPVAPQSDLPGSTLPGIDSNGVTIELASLYSPVGPGSPNAPDPCGPLVLVTVDRGTCLTITPNIARAGPTGVVMENPDEVVTVSMAGACVYDPCSCMKYTHPAYGDWVALGRPVCWCYARQCRGDIDGLKYGPFWVQVVDLDIFKTAFNKTDAQLSPGGVCADLDHIKYGPFRVNVVDLDIFKQYFNKAEAAVPCCDIDGDCILTADDYYFYWAIQ